jgi:hypothetical protein
MKKQGLHGILPDGHSVNVRLESTYTKLTSATTSAPTIEIMKSGGGDTQIKFILN